MIQEEQKEAIDNVGEETNKCAINDENIMGRIEEDVVEAVEGRKEDEPTKTDDVGRSEVDYNSECRHHETVVLLTERDRVVRWDQHIVVECQECGYCPDISCIQ